MVVKVDIEVLVVVSGLGIEGFVVGEMIQIFGWCLWVKN